MPKCKNGYRIGLLNRSKNKCNNRETIWINFKKYWEWHFLENTYRKIAK
jgi:hypothetical protein